MLNALKISTAAVCLALGLVAGPAQAVFIQGSVTVSDTLDPAFLPADGTSIVGDLTSIHHLAPAGNTGGGTVDFSLSNGPLNAAMLTWVFANPGGTLNEISIPGFSFDITSATFGAKVPLVCGPTSCTDALIYTISGIVTGAGFDPTAFTGSLALTGSCVGNGTACTGSYSGGYTYSLAATGTTTVPEPGTLALLGLGLAGLGFASRRKQS